MTHKQKYKIKPKPRTNWFVIIILGAILCIAIPWMLIGVALFLSVYGISQIRILHSTRQNYGFLGNEEDVIKYILALAAYIVKSDTQIGVAEQKHIEDSIRHDFKEKYSDRYIAQFNKYLKLNINIKRVCQSLRAQYTISSTIHLMHFLVELVAVDGVLTSAEEHKLFAIARNLRLPYSSLRSIIRMFNLQRETEDRTERNGSSKKGRNNNSLLRKAYHILDISADVSDDKLKRAFRKLAKLHHPDKVAYLGKLHQEKATIRFQTMVDAYTLIKKSRNLA